MSIINITHCYGLYYKITVSGLVTVPAGGGGTFLGGYLIKRFNLSCSGILKFCLLATTACIAFTLCFALNCPNLDFAGLTVPYQSNISRFVVDRFILISIL